MGTGGELERRGGSALVRDRVRQIVVVDQDQLLAPTLKVYFAALAMTLNPRSHQTYRSLRCRH